MASFPTALVLVTALTLVTSVQSDGCFGNPAIFQAYTRYLQPLSLENRIYYDPSPFEDATKMTAEKEINLPKYWKKTYTCLEEYEGNRILVEVVDETKNKIHFQCLQYSVVTENIIRQAKTRLRSSREKVNCNKDKFDTDEALLVAWGMMQPQPCPFKGDYQMILHEGEMIKGHCLDSVLTYNPYLRFQCDGHNVIADFGKSCQPHVLGDFQKMRRRHVAHLSCVGNWSESGDVKSVMLRMRDMPYDFWCIHYKRINESSDFLSIFMTLDGRCVENAFHDEAFPPKTSMFGQLASYIPSNDPRCSDPQHESCNNNEDKCFESDRCPRNCQRCNSKSDKSPCSFLEDTRGSWKTVDSRTEMTVDIADDMFDVSGYGKFYCHDEADRDLPGKVYPVVQEDDTSSCMPYYACANVVSTVPGVLNFKLQPVWRDQDSGRTFSCKETADKIGYVTPVDDEKMLTMVNFDKLERSSCGFESLGNYSLVIPGCNLIVEPCDGDCSDLNVHYDMHTCGDQSSLGFEIETDHICYGKFDFQHSVKGMLTYSDFSERYFCWIYETEIAILFIAPPSHCNSESVGRILKDNQAYVTYDPAERLMKPMTGSSGDPNMGRSLNPGGGVEIQSVSSAVLVFLLSSLCFLVLTNRWN